MSHVLIPLFSTCTERRQLSCNVVKVKLLGQYGTCMLKWHTGTPTLRCEGAVVGGQAVMLSKENVGTLGWRRDVIRKDELFVKL